MIHIHSVNGYMPLLSWRLSNILQLTTQGFCKHFVDYNIDPCGRLRDQMEMAARTVPANIAEGSSRHQTSYETEMRLLDVSRASISELEGDFTENMTQERLSTIKEKSTTEGAPLCPKCGSPMRLKMIRKGIHQGEQFWGCTDYPKCDGTRPLR